jgi:hypothetical protein
LGFVCTGQTVEGAPGLEGYYFDYGREIAESERVRFSAAETAPDFDAAKAPRLDTADWPEERLKKVERSYAMEYVRSLVPTMLDLFGPDETRAQLGRAARLVGLQLYDDTAALMGVEPGAPEAFAAYLGQFAAAQGEEVEVDGATVRQAGWRLMQGLTPGEAGFRAWNALFEGALAVHNRRLSLVTTRAGDGVEWRIVG